MDDIESAFGNRDMTDKLLSLDYRTATPECIKDLIQKGACPHVSICFSGDDNEIHDEGPLDKAILAKNLPVAKYLISQNVKHHFERWKMHLSELSFLIENGLEKVENPLVEYSKIAKNDANFDETYLPLLAKYKDNLNKQNDDGETPLMVLIDKCYYEHRKPLIRTLYAIVQNYEIDYTLTDSYGRNLLYYVKDSRLDEGWFNSLGKELVETIKERTFWANEQKHRIARQSNMSNVNPYGRQRN